MATKHYTEKKSHMTFKRDWKKLEKLACDVCNASMDNDEKETAILLAYLEQLELKYPNNINVMASHADFILDDMASALKLYLKAYDLAKEKQDYMNCTYISSSIASLYLTNDDLANGENWISYLEKDLLNFSDDYTRNELITYKKCANDLKTTMP